MNEHIREGFIPDATAAATEPAPAAPPPATEKRVETWPVRVKLIHRAVRDSKNQEVRELAFREPTAGDINRYGNPVRIDLNGMPVIDEQKMSLMMSALSGVLSPFLDRMDPRDWNSCAYRLRPFFLPDPDAWD